MNNKNTAILIFANSAEKEAENKVFCKNSGLFEILNKETLQKVKKSGLPYFHFTEKEQIGETFGERYTYAIQFVYDQGFENVITIGNDTPHLQTSQLLETAKKLSKNPIVLGPSRDGGYYLMGIHKSQFSQEIFLKLPWQTSHLTKSIKRILSSRKIKVLTLKVLSDIDAATDVKAVLNSFKQLSSALKKLLLSLFSSEEKHFKKLTYSFSIFAREICFNKGSPVLN